MNEDRMTPPIIRAIAAALRYAAGLIFTSDVGRAEVLYETARDVELWEPGDTDWCCPVCQETECDPGCPMEPLRRAPVDTMQAMNEERMKEIREPTPCLRCGFSHRFQYPDYSDASKHEADVTACINTLLGELDALKRERDELVERIKQELFHAEANELSLVGQGVALGEDVPAVRISNIEAALRTPQTTEDTK